MILRRFPASVFRASLSVAFLFAASAAPHATHAQSQPISLTEAPASINFPAEHVNDSDAECDQRADSPSDPRRVGAGVEIDKIDIARASAFCQSALAATSPERPRYVFLYGRVLLANKDYADARAQFVKADQAGSAMGALALGYMCLNGLGGAQDTDEAMRLFWRAGVAGVPDGFANGGMVRMGANPPDYENAASWFNRAVEMGPSKADFYLGYMNLRGLGVPRNPNRAAQLLQRAYKAGDLQANFLLATMYERGEGGLPRDPRGAVEMLAASAAAGDPYAQVELGNCYYNGVGVAVNHGSAALWYFKAGQTGMPDAQEFLGYMYETGDGIVPDQSLATQWFRQAAIHGNVRAMTELGIHLRQGNGVAWNEAEAMEWFTKAAAQGDVQAMSAAGLGLDKGLGGGPQDYAQAARYFDEAARRGDGFAALNLGYLFEQGWGVQQSAEQARNYYALASRDRNPKIAALGAQYYDGMRDTPAPAAERATVSSSTDSSDFWGAVVVGALAVGAITAVTSNSSSDASASNSTTDTTPDYNLGASQRWNDYALDRMAQGCFWSMDTTGFLGSCHH
jgi:TPR repeat protein